MHYDKLLHNTSCLLLPRCSSSFSHWRTYLLPDGTSPLKWCKLSSSSPLAFTTPFLAHAAHPSRLLLYVQSFVYFFPDNTLRFPVTRFSSAFCLSPFPRPPPFLSSRTFPFWSPEGERSFCSTRLSEQARGLLQVIGGPFPDCSFDQADVAVGKRCKWECMISTREGWGCCFPIKFSSELQNCRIGGKSDEGLIAAPQLRLLLFSSSFTPFCIRMNFTQTVTDVQKAWMRMNNCAEQ